MARPLANLPFDESRFLPDMPASPNMQGLSTQELISFDKPAMPIDLDDIAFPAPETLDQFQRPNPVFSPLNDLKSPADEKAKLSKELEQLASKLERMKGAGELAEQLKTAEIEQGLHDQDLCDDCIRSLSRHGRKSGLHGLDDEVEWRRRLRAHVDHLNDELFKDTKRKELLPMDVLPPFAYRPDEDREARMREKEQYRMELEQDMEKRDRAKLSEYESGQKHSNELNTADAQAYADEKVKLKKLQEANERYDAEFNKKQMELKRMEEKREAQQMEWWEQRRKADEVRFDRDSQHYMDQLKRNEFLKRNLYNLQEFEEKFRDQKEAQWAMRYPHQADVKAKVEIQSELTRPEAARRARENLESVWDQWVDAHRRNDKRKKVLQDYDLRIKGEVERAERDQLVQVELAHGSRQRCCRRCHRPLLRRAALAH